MAQPENKDIMDGLDEALDEKDTVEKEEEETTEKEDTSDEEVPDEDGEVEEEEDKEEDAEDTEEEEESEEDTSKSKVPSLITRAKTKYPGVFKEFPELKEAFFKHREYEQVFGSIEEAREAASVAEGVAGLTQALREGNPGPLMDTIYEEDPEALKAMAMSFLPTLHSKSNKLFSAVITPIINNMFAGIAKTAAENGNEDLLLAVRYCARAIGLGSDVPRPTKVGLPKRNPEVESERRALVNERETQFFDATEDRANPVIDEEILKGLDPDGALPEGLREATVEKIRNGVFKLLAQNPNYMRRMRALRNAAVANGYSKEYQKKIAKAVIEAAKELIPSQRAKYRKRMLGNLVKDKKDTTPAVPQSGNDNANVGGKDKKAVEIDWKTTSMREALDKVI